MTNTADSDTPDTYKQLWDQRCALRNVALVSYRYHRRRQRFFDLLDKLTKCGTVLLGATLFGEVFKNNLPVAASLISGMGLLALIFSYGDKKQTHKELSELSMQLVGSIDAQPRNATTDTLISGWQQDLSRLNAKEPPTLHTLVTLCEHQQATADGHPSHIPLPPMMRRLLADFKS
jgi:hypothetical protein